jgi:hypothetical protein
MSEKEKLLQRIGTDLLGPTSEDELLDPYPTDVYLTGLLFPPASGIAEEDADQLQAEGRQGADDSDVSADEVSLASVKRPASAGISFVVDSDQKPTISIRFTGAVYRRDPDAVESPAGVPGVGDSSGPESQESPPEDHETEQGETESSSAAQEGGKVPWRRMPVVAELDDVELNLGSRDFAPEDTGVPGLGLHIRTSPWEGRMLVTVAMINEHTLPEEYERDSMEEITFFQTSLTVTPGHGTGFHPRPIGGSAIDDDTRMSRLIYRDVKEYAVGHTCSAEWSGDGEQITSVSSTWLPVSVVKSMSSRGVDEFSPMYEAGVLDTRWLAETGGASLVEGLKKLPTLYGSWCDKQTEILPELDESQAEQARRHLENASNVRERMLGAIDLIETHEDV